MVRYQAAVTPRNALSSNYVIGHTLLCRQDMLLALLQDDVLPSWEYFVPHKWTTKHELIGSRESHSTSRCWCSSCLLTFRLLVLTLIHDSVPRLASLGLLASWALRIAAR